MNRRDSKKVFYAGILFDSGHERDVYRDQLEPLLRAGKIHALDVHKTFRFIVNDVYICSMKPDFCFIDTAGIFGSAGLFCILDAKGFKTSKKTGKLLPRLNRESGLKKKLMLACFGFDVKYV